MQDEERIGLFLDYENLAIGARFPTGAMGRIRWAALRALRTEVTERIEPLRRDKIVGSSLEAEIWVPSDEDPALLEELFITSTVHRGDWKVVKTDNRKCARCWRHRASVGQCAAHPDLCERCESVVASATKLEGRVPASP